MYGPLVIERWFSDDLHGKAEIMAANSAIMLVLTRKSLAEYSVVELGCPQ